MTEKIDNAVEVLELFKRLRDALRKVNDLVYDHIGNIHCKVKGILSSKIAYSVKIRKPQTKRNTLNSFLTQFNNLHIFASTIQCYKM